MVDYLTPCIHGDSEHAYRSRLESRCEYTAAQEIQYVVGFILVTTNTAASN